MQQKEVTYPKLPLAVYREIAAHLEQIIGVTTTIIPQQSREFDYQQSQVNSLLIEYDKNLDPAAQQQMQEIIDYYRQRYP